MLEHTHIEKRMNFRDSRVFDDADLTSNGLSELISPNILLSLPHTNFITILYNLHLVIIFLLPQTLDFSFHGYIRKFVPPCILEFILRTCDWKKTVDIHEKKPRHLRQPCNKRND